MNLELSEDQQILKQSVQGALRSSYGFDARKRGLESDKGWQDEAWMMFAEQGLLGLPFAESDGGYGASRVELMIVLEALGKSLVLEPFIPTVVVGGGFLRHGGSPAQRKEIVPSIVNGSRTMAFAQLERQARYDLHDVATNARQASGAFVLNGRKCVVPGGGSADLLIVSARTAGDRCDRDGIGVFIVPADAKGVHVEAYKTHDGSNASDIVFEEVTVGPEAVLGDPIEGARLIETVIDEARVALCSEAVGAMDEAMAITMEYLKTRRQFGTTIGSFQALQHRAADMLVAIEQARGITMFATVACDSADADERTRAVSAAKYRVGNSAKFIGEQCVQLHGGVGMGMEASIGQFFKRLTMIDRCYGDSTYHLQRLAELGGLPS